MTNAFFLLDLYAHTGEETQQKNCTHLWCLYLEENWNISDEEECWKMIQGAENKPSQYSVYIFLLIWRLK